MRVRVSIFTFVLVKQVVNLGSTCKCASSGCMFVTVLLVVCVLLALLAQNLCLCFTSFTSSDVLALLALQVLSDVLALLALLALMY